MINTVIYLWQSYSAVSEILPRVDYGGSRRKSRPADVLTSTGEGVCLCLFVFFNFPCVFILLAAEERLSMKFFLHIVANKRALLQARV